jgi:Mn2+/Fe2+ NRAMP family transporter
VLICMMLIINKKDVMDKYTNKPLQNIIGWVTISVLVALSLFMVGSFVFQT